LEAWLGAHHIVHGTPSLRWIIPASRRPGTLFYKSMIWIRGLGHTRSRAI
jgi:hypothetical protein